MATPAASLAPADAVQAAASSRRARREAAAVAAAVVATVAATAEAPAATELDVIAPVEPELTAQPLAAPAALTTPEVSEISLTETSRSIRSDAAEDVEHEVPPVPTPGAGESAADAFAAAASAFGIAADSAPRSSRRATRASMPTVVAERENGDVAIPARTPRRRFGMPRKVLAGSATLGVMGMAGLIAVSMTLPSTAIAAAQSDGAQANASLVASDLQGTEAGIDDEEIQAYVASSDVKGEAVTRTEDFSTVSLSDLAAEEGISYSSSLYTNNPDAAIQWPFVVGVAMSSTYGMRNGRMHEGIDLVPGAGAPIQSIADGTVRIATEAGGNYGVTVYIDHEIDGQIITSHYSHMQYGSLRVKTGDKVKVGDIVGKVGNTGRSYGAHLHFELILNGAKIDPLPWLQKNAGRMSY